MMMEGGEGCLFIYFLEAGLLREFAMKPRSVEAGHLCDFATKPRGVWSHPNDPNKDLKRQIHGLI
jgi:hypothetical protein